MIRVVLDTNIVISAHLVTAGMPHAIFNFALSRRIELYVSPQIMAEYEEVLRRPRLKISPDKATHALAHIGKVAVMMTPTQTLTVCTDPDDNMFLECAQAAKADYLVTGNLRHFPKRWQDTQIVTAREFLDVITNIPRNE